MCDKKWSKYANNILNVPLNYECTYSSRYGHASCKNLVVLFIYTMFELVTVGLRIFMNLLLLLLQLLFGLCKFLVDYSAKKKSNFKNWKWLFALLGMLIILLFVFAPKNIWMTLLWKFPIMQSFKPCCVRAENFYYYNLFGNNDYLFRSNIVKPEEDSFNSLSIFCDLPCFLVSIIYILENVTKSQDTWSIKNSDDSYTRKAIIPRTIDQLQQSPLKIRFKNLNEEVADFLAVEKTFTFTLMDEQKNILYETSTKFNVSVLEMQPLLVKVPTIVLEEYDLI